ncbi:MAG: sigma-54-dependent transcriptional regulator [Rhodothermales bacterium]
MSFRIFIVDDDPEYSALLQFQLRKIENVDIQTFSNGEDVINALGQSPHLILLDLVMPGQGGLETLRQIKLATPKLPVIVVSSQSVVSVALEALKLGAYDYVTKGYDDTMKINKLAEQIAERTKLTQEVSLLREQLRVPHGIPGMTGESASMGKVFRLINKTLVGGLSVAIVGESGTGKELVAHTIHYNSPRKRQSFVVVNCAAIPRELMESEFFGHEKGSFTGAYTRKTGKFEQANQGTIFLDEIGELNLDLQAKLLRVLQNQEVQRVGSNETIRVDVRVICATNRDIISMIQDGQFREDLYYRLFQFPINLPPLRERDQDTLLLATFFRKDFLKRHPDVQPRELSAASRRKVLEYDWPGNVRQLKNAIERALLISDTDEIIPDDLMLDAMRIIKRPKAPSQHPAVTDSSISTETRGSAEMESNAGSSNPYSGLTATMEPKDIMQLEDVKRMAVMHAYKLCKGNVDQTSLRLGVTRSTIYRLLDKYKQEGEDITT